MPKYVSSVDLARFLGVSDQNVAFWLKTGRIPPARKVGKKRMHDFQAACQAVIENGLAISFDRYDEVAAFVSQDVTTFETTEAA